MLTFVIWLCVLFPSLSLVYFSAEVLFGLRPLPSPPSIKRDLKLAVVMPAHNEAAIIAGTVTALRPQVSPETQIVVVADNCSDGTAQIAGDAGAKVIERNDLSRRGKGFALAFARDFLAKDPPDAVFILDADCAVARGNIESIAVHAMSTGGAVQSVYLLEAPKNAASMVQVSNFAFMIKNVVRARGLYRMGGGIPLFGTGIAFPWHVFERVELATSDPVEDLRLSLVLAKQGIRAHFNENLHVTSAAADVHDSFDQRRRWEHGFLSNASRYGLPLVGAGLVRGSRHLAALGAHLLVPPLALLFLLATVAFIPAVILAILFGNIGPAVLLGAAIGGALTVTAVAWYREGRATLSLSALARAPLYVLWKVPLYLGFFSSRQTEWNRTRRINEKN